MASTLTKWPYVKKPLFISIGITSLTAILTYFMKADDVVKIVISVNDATTNFALSFVGFSVTALALLSFAQNQKFFGAVAKSPYFRSFLDRFFLSTKIAICLLLYSFTIRFIIPFLTHIIGMVILSLTVGIISFLAIWVWKCIDDLIDIFKE
jgi:hypothetical protein